MSTILIALLIHSICVVSVNDTDIEAQSARSAKETSLQAASAYNSPWPKGRGFRVGETVPDIPLFDMKGKEVRFSKYLGKRCILYCWASW